MENFFYSTLSDDMTKKYKLLLDCGTKKVGHTPGPCTQAHENETG
jgi:hypothetical protein